MLTITFQGNTYDVPEWARFIAGGVAGATYAYSDLPSLHDSG